MDHEGDVDVEGAPAPSVLLLHDSNRSSVLEAEVPVAHCCNADDRSSTIKRCMEGKTE